MSILTRLLNESLLLEHVRLNRSGHILEVNTSFAKHVRIPQAELVGSSIYDLLVEQGSEQVRESLETRTAPAGSFFLNFGNASEVPYTLHCIAEWQHDGLAIIGEPDLALADFTMEEVLAINNDLAALSREHARRGKQLDQAHQQLRATLDELEKSYWHLRKIQEVIPSCMACGNIKTDEHTWQSVSDYLLENKIFLSHGYCPACMDRIHAELDRTGL